MLRGIRRMPSLSGTLARDSSGKPAGTASAGARSLRPSDRRARASWRVPAFLRTHAAWRDLVASRGPAAWKIPGAWPGPPPSAGPAPLAELAPGAALAGRQVFQNPLFFPTPLICATRRLPHVRDWRHCERLRICRSISPATAGFRVAWPAVPAAKEIRRNEKKGPGGPFSWTSRKPRRRLEIEIWSGRRVSNSRPQPWQGCALPTELLPHFPAPNASGSIRSGSCSLQERRKYTQILKLCTRRCRALRMDRAMRQASA